MRPFGTIAGMLEHMEKNYSNNKAFNYLENEKWHSISTKSFLEQVRYLTLTLVNLGLKKGDPVGILANPSPFWTIADLAIIMAGGVSVPLFANLAEENFIFEVAQTNLKILFVEGHDQWQLYERNRHFFNTVILLDPADQRKKAISYAEALKIGEIQENKNPGLYLQLSKRQKESDLASIVYTSGSTGVPKGVELTHGNLLGVAHVDVFHLKKKEDRYLSILPLAHIFGRALNLIMVAWGVDVYYFNDLKNLVSACQKVHPTIVVVVPRLLEKIYTKIWLNARNASPLKRKIALWALHLAQQPDGGIGLALKRSIAKRLVYSKLQGILGGCLRTMISGGAALNPQLAQFFVNIGYPLYEGWGMTEASTVAVNRVGRRKIGTVGIPLEGMEVKIDSQNNEIVIRGPLVMRGYYRNPEATAAVLDANGWLRTGDKGTIDQDGFVAIVGRIKDIFKASTGEYVVPGPIEHELCRLPLVDMAMVVGEKKKFASCLLFPNLEVLHHLKAAHGMSEISDEDFLNGEIVKQEVAQFIEALNHHLNHWEQIHGFRFIPHPLTIESGELTPSMKIRRDVVTKKYQRYIDEIYHEEAA